MMKMNNVPNNTIIPENPKSADKLPVLLAPQTGRRAFWKSAFGERRYLGLYISLKDCGTF